MNVKNETMY